MSCKKPSVGCGGQKASGLLHAAHRGQAANPIAHVLQAIDEPLDLIEYNSWNVVLPEGSFLTEVCIKLIGPRTSKLALSLADLNQSVFWLL